MLMLSHNRIKDQVERERLEEEKMKSRKDKRTNMIALRELTKATIEKNKALDWNKWDGMFFNHYEVLYY